MARVLGRADRERMQLRAETEELGGELEQLAKAKVSDWHWNWVKSYFGFLFLSEQNENKSRLLASFLRQEKNAKGQSYQTNVNTI